MRFDFRNAKTTTRKMQLLEQFVRAWYGPRADSYGVPESVLQDLDLPMPLRRFYRFAGRWPARLPATETGLEYFYTGAGYHHLQPVDGVKETHDGFIQFYMEYQGEWDILTKPGNRSTNVWLRGCWDGCPIELEDELFPTTELPFSLVDFLISHIFLPRSSSIPTT